MKLLAAWFTQEQSPTNFTSFGLAHLAIIALLIFIIWFSYRPERSKSFEKFLVWAILINQLVLYAWYAMGPDLLNDGLPFYTCRLADIFFIIGYFANKNLFKAMGIYFGFIGGLAAIISPELYPHSIFHFTNINFFFSHFVLIALSLYYMRHDEENIIVSKLKPITLITLLILVAISVFNFFAHTNYAYTVTSPIAPEVVGRLPFIIYFSILVAAYEVSIIAQGRIIKAIQAKQMRK